MAFGESDGREMLAGKLNEDRHDSGAGQASFQGLTRCGVWLVCGGPEEPKGPAKSWTSLQNTSLPLEYTLHESDRFEMLFCL